MCESCVVAGCCFHLGLYQIVVLSGWFFARRKNWTGRRIEEKIKSRSVRQLLKDYHPLGKQLENHILCNSFGSLDLCLCLCLSLSVNSIHNSIHNARERRDIQELVLHWHSRYKGTRSALPCRMSLLCSSKVSARCKKQIFSSILMQMFLIFLDCKSEVLGGFLFPIHTENVQLLLLNVLSFLCFWF